MTDDLKCFEINCDGTVRKATITHKVTLSNSDTIKIDNLAVERCDRCGEILFDSAASKTVEAAILAKYPDHFKRYKR
jgi:YgiT-type zinc finger domain-containing protein